MARMVDVSGRPGTLCLLVDPQEPNRKGFILQLYVKKAHGTVKIYRQNATEC